MARVLFLLACAAATLPGRLLAQDPSQLGAALVAACGVPIDPTNEGVVAGTVTDSVSGAPLPGARVTIEWQTPGDTLAHAFETESGLQGFYAFCKVPAGVRVTLEANLRVASEPVELDIEAGNLHVEPIRLRLSDPDSKGVLVGRIVDAELRQPVGNAIVRLVELSEATTTNSRGYFSFGTQPWGVYTLEIASLGYSPLTTAIRVAGNLTQNVEILLAPDALKLEGITVTATAQQGRQIDGLIRRMTLGAGNFITREIIERRPGARAADFLQEVPGISVRRGLYGQINLEVRGRECVPDVFVDGTLYALDPDLGLDFYAGELEAVEVYKGVQVPGEFLRAGRVSFPCAVIVAWTRRGK